jgi:molecular chaperone DnaK (HSP70)
VPSYFSNVERQAVLDACEIAELKCLRLLNEATAVCLNYGFFRKSDFAEKGGEGRNVVFVDFGHSKMTVTVATFWKGKNKIICHVSDRNLGARDID